MFSWRVFSGCLLHYQTCLMWQSLTLSLTNTHTHTNWTMLDVWSVVHFDVPEDRTLTLFPCLHVVEFVCLKIFINSWVKTYHCFNLSHMSHYFIALWNFFHLSNLIFSFLVNRKYLEEPCVWVESNTTTLSILSSHAEIGLGFLLIISLFSWDSQRYFFFLFQSLWFFFFSFHSYVFVCVCSWCLLDSNIIYLQVAAQHNTNFHVLAGSLYFFSIIYRDLPFFFSPHIWSLKTLC